MASSLRQSKRQGLRVSLLDRFLVGIAPNWGMRRIRARASLGLFGRHYEASSTGRRTSNWFRSSSDANAAAAPSLTTLRELSRDMRRNNPIARRAVQAVVNNTIGSGIVPRVLDLDGDVARAAWNIWEAWAETPRCDYDGRLTFYGLQRLVMETVVESGEALVVRELADMRDGLPVPMRIRVLEPDYLDSLKEGELSNGNLVQQGIEFDGRGRRVAYWLFERHPGSVRALGGGSVHLSASRRIPATDVLHVYQADRPGLARGVPWLAPIIPRLKDLDDYEDAVLNQQRVSACFGVFVKDTNGEPLGEEDEADPSIEELGPGHVNYLNPGEDVSVISPPSTANHAPYVQSQHRQIAAGLGITYEDLANDYSMVNFSSARMGRLSSQRNVEEWRWNMIIPQLCDGVWRWLMEFTAAMLEWPTVPRAEWVAPPLPMLEPEKEGLAYTRLIRSGVMTLGQAIRERGGNLDAHLEEIADTNALLDLHKIWLDSDPRRTSAAGLTQERPGGDVGGGGFGGGESDDEERFATNTLDRRPRLSSRSG